MTPRPTRDEYLAAVRTVKERAARVAPPELRDLLNRSPVRSVTLDLPVEVALIRERHEPSRGILVVAQAFRPWFRSFRRAGDMFVDGFVLHPDGCITEASADDLSDYT
jgi:hypothetical protein